MADITADPLSPASNITFTMLTIRPRWKRLRYAPRLFWACQHGLGTSIRLAFRITWNVITWTRPSSQ